MANTRQPVDKEFLEDAKTYIDVLIHKVQELGLQDSDALIKSYENDRAGLEKASDRVASAIVAAARRRFIAFCEDTVEVDLRYPTPDPAHRDLVVGAIPGYFMETLARSRPNHEAFTGDTQQLIELMRNHNASVFMGSPGARPDIWLEQVIAVLGEALGNATNPTRIVEPVFLALSPVEQDEKGAKAHELVDEMCNFYYLGTDLNSIYCAHAPYGSFGEFAVHKTLYKGNMPPFDPAQVPEVSPEWFHPRIGGSHGTVAFCGSAYDSYPHYKELTRELGKMVVGNEWGICTGAAGSEQNGLMYAIAQAGGTDYPSLQVMATGVPWNEYFTEHARRQIVAPELFDRMDKMAENSDAIVMIPGGLGSMLEIAHFIRLKEEGRCGMENKPIVILIPENLSSFAGISGYFDPESQFMSVFTNLIQDIGLGNSIHIARNPQQVEEILHQEMHREVAFESRRDLVMQTVTGVLLGAVCNIVHEISEGRPPLEAIRARLEAVSDNWSAMLEAEKAEKGREREPRR